MGSNRVNRGGSWNNDARNCRSANRNRNDPENRNNNLGFRLARSSADRVDALPDGTGRFPVPFLRGQNTTLGRPVLVANPRKLKAAVFLVSS